MSPTRAATVSVTSLPSQGQQTHPYQHRPDQKRQQRADSMRVSRAPLSVWSHGEQTTGPLKRDGWRRSAVCAHLHPTWCSYCFQRSPLPIVLMYDPSMGSTLSTLFSITVPTSSTSWQSSVDGQSLAGWQTHDFEVLHNGRVHRGIARDLCKCHFALHDSLGAHSRSWWVWRCEPRHRRNLFHH